MSSTLRLILILPAVVCNIVAAEQPQPQQQSNWWDSCARFLGFVSGPDSDSVAAKPSGSVAFLGKRDKNNLQEVAVSLLSTSGPVSQVDVHNGEANILLNLSTDVFAGDVVAEQVASESITMIDHGTFIGVGEDHTFPSPAIGAAGLTPCVDGRSCSVVPDSK